MAALVPRHIHALACSGDDAPPSALLLDDSTLLCAAPRALVAHPLTKQEKIDSSSTPAVPLLRWAALSAGACGIAALARSPDGALLALAERGGQSAGCVLLLDAHTLRRRIALTLPHAATAVSALAFSCDASLLFAGLSQSSDSNASLLAAWRVDSPSPAAVLECGAARVRALAAHPHDARCVALLASSAAPKLFRLDAGRLAPTPLAGRPPPAREAIAAVAWLRGRGGDLLLASASGNVYLCGGSSEGSVAAPVAHVAAGATAAAALPDGGFVIGAPDGSVTLFAAPPRGRAAAAHATQPPARSVPLGAGAVLSLSTDETHLLAACADAALAVLTLRSSSSTDAPPPRLLRFHVPGDVAIGVLDRGGAAIASAGAGGVLRVWRGLAAADTPLEARLPAPPERCVLATHPSGMFAAAGCAGGARLLALCADRPRLVGELRCCSGAADASALAYSRAGGALAVAVGADVFVFDAWSRKLVSVFRTPAFDDGASVEALAWASQDTRLVCAYSDGALRSWEVAAGACAAETALPPLSRRALTAAPADAVLAAAADGGVLLLCAATLEPLPAPPLAPGVHARSLALCGDGTTLFIGTTAGAVLALPLYADSHIDASDCLDEQHAVVALHGAPVTALALARRGRSLFSASSDGTVCEFTVDGSGQDLHSDPFMDEEAEEEEEEAVLVAPGALAAAAAAAAASEAAAAEARAAAALAARVAAADSAAAAAAASAAAAARLAAERRRADALEAELSAAAADADAAVRNIEARSRVERDACERAAAARVAAASERADAAVAARDATAAAAAAAAALAERAAAEALAEAVADGEARAAADAVEVERAAAERDAACADAASRLAATEAEADAEIEALKMAHAERLQLERDASLRLRGELGMTKRRAEIAARAADAARADAARSSAALAGETQRADAAEAEVTRLRATCAQQEAALAQAAAAAEAMASTLHDRDRALALADHSLEQATAAAAPAAAAEAAAEERAAAAREAASAAAADAHASRRAAADAQARAIAARNDAAAQRRATVATQRRLDALLADLTAAAASLCDAKALKAAVRAMHARHLGSAAAGADAAPSASPPVAQALPQDMAAVVEATTAAAAKAHASEAAVLRRAASGAAAEAARVIAQNSALVAELAAMRAVLMGRSRQGAGAAAASAAAAAGSARVGGA